MTATRPWLRAVDDIDQPVDDRPPLNAWTRACILGQLERQTDAAAIATTGFARPLPRRESPHART